MLGAIRVGRKKHIQPIVSWKIMRKLLALLLMLSGVGYAITYFRTITIPWFFIVAIVLNLIIVYISLPVIKKIAK